jgi:hypothetical protein
VKATVTDAEDYALIDRYLERGIASAGLNSAAALAGFLGLDEVVVDRALRFLAGIGHVAFAGDRVTLTELGKPSVRDEKRYLVTRRAYGRAGVMTTLRAAHEAARAARTAALG